MTEQYFVQVGASRDGRDSYLDAARRRGLTTVLVETPDYRRWRKAMGRREFDVTLSVDHPSHAPDVVASISELAGTTRLLLAGYERYVRSAWRAAEAMGACP